jgi:translation initiation factor IF-3
MSRGNRPFQDHVSTSSTTARLAHESIGGSAVQTSGSSIMTGDKGGPIHIEEALRRAQELELDLVDVAATAAPACPYRRQRQVQVQAGQEGARREKHQHVSEGGFACGRTNDHDLQARLGAARRFP